MKLSHNWFNHQSGKPLNKIQHWLCYPFTKFYIRAFYWMLLCLYILIIGLVLLATIKIVFIL